jgi:RNA polymerase sigma-70 factor (ECF subfamily)
VDPDRGLVDRAREGDQEAFADLVARYRSRVFNLARALTANDADADDLAQDVFVRVFKGLGGFRGDSAFRTWLYRVALNVIRSHLRRPSLFAVLRRPDAVDETRPVDPLDEVADPEDVETRVVQRDAIDRALGRLVPNLRVAVTLRDIEGLDYREIADVLGVPIGTVMSRIARGREKLRPWLAPLIGATDSPVRSTGGETTWSPAAQRRR